MNLRSAVEGAADGEEVEGGEGTERLRVKRENLPEDLKDWASKAPGADVEHTRTEAKGADVEHTRTALVAAWTRCSGLGGW